MSKREEWEEKMAQLYADKEAWDERFIKHATDYLAPGDTSDWLPEPNMENALDCQFFSDMVDDRTSCQIEKAVISRYATRRTADFADCLGECIQRLDSPIERVMLSALALIGIEQIDGSMVHLDYDHNMAVSDFRSGYEHLIIQPQVPIGKYRADFLLTHCVCEGPYVSKEHPYHITKAVVECDGHDFHERTKDQASRDRRRDRALQRLGYKVYRFTGSDIWKNAIECADEVISDFQNQTRQLFRAMMKAHVGPTLG